MTSPAPPERMRLHAVVRGRVQGVGFRAWTESEARSLGLTGWVRNLPDGRAVEVIAEGPKDALDRLLGFLRQGPPGALVESVEQRWGRVRQGMPSRFVVRF